LCTPAQHLQRDRTESVSFDFGELPEGRVEKIVRADIEALM
jgi:hypothetical protein